MKFAFRTLPLTRISKIKFSISIPCRVHLPSLSGGLNVMTLSPAVAEKGKVKLLIKLILVAINSKDFFILSL